MAAKKSQNQHDADSAHNALIRAEQIRIIYNNMPSVLLSNSVVPLLMLYALWDKPERVKLIVWVSLMFGVVILRLSLLVAYRHAAPLSQSIDRWGILLVVTALISGILWGAAGVIIAVPAANEQFSFIVLVLHAIGAAAVISYASYMPVFYAFFFPMLLPLATALLMEQIDTRYVIAYTSLLYVVVVSSFGRNLHKVFTESLRLRFQNIDLVNELIKQKDELKTQKEIAERANAAKTRFLAAASHDLRQPLHAMGLFVSALSEHVRDVVSRKLVSQLSASTEALRGLLNSLLDISRLDAGVIHPRVTQCSVQNLFDQIAIDCSPQAEDKNISLRIVSTTAWVKCDATLLERIIRNLVSNAIRYTDKGTVLLGCRHRGEQLRIEVWDSGIGIAENELNNIFHEFYQIGNPERDRSNGLGLGLAIAQRLARLFDNRIEVRSVLGKGSVFALTLPKCTAKVACAELPATSTTGQLQSSLIVVIDDELAIRQATQMMLESWGCAALLADTGDAALIAVAKSGRKPNAIIADYRLRNNETGVDAVHGLHEVYGCDIPVVIITGDTAPDRLRETEASGYHLLHKPLAPARLRALLTHVITGA